MEVPLGFSKVEVRLSGIDLNMKIEISKDHKRNQTERDSANNTDKQGDIAGRNSVRPTLSFFRKLSQFFANCRKPEAFEAFFDSCQKALESSHDLSRIQVTVAGFN